MNFRTIFTSVAALLTAAVIAVTLGLSIVDSRAEAQGCALTGRNICANEVTPGEVRVSWGSLPREALYRVGWVNMEHFRQWVPARAPQDMWLNIFNFRDVENASSGGGTTIIDLTPGVEYAFIAAPLGDRWGNPSNWGWSDWLYLTTEVPASCPVGNPANPAAPGGTPTAQPTASWQPTPTPWPTERPTPTPTPVPTPTPTPAPTLDPRLAVCPDWLSDSEYQKLVDEGTCPSRPWAS